MGPVTWTKCSPRRKRKVGSLFFIVVTCFLPPPSSSLPFYPIPYSSAPLAYSLVSTSGWKPFTMKAPFLGVLVVLSLGLAGVIEYLAQVSARNGGGLALSRSEDDMPRAVTLAYLYLPTTVAVAYSLLWTCVDVDVRRLQPWLELSRPGGARGDRSLLLDYPFEFLPLLPVSAGKRGHWPVALVGLVMMSVFWVITPLQGAIL